MKCYVCGTENIENKARCPLCDFPVPSIVDESELVKLKEISDKYRSNKLRGIKIGIIIYSHKKEGENLLLNCEEMLTLAEGEQLRPGKTVWCEQKFARVDSEETIRLTVWLKKDNQQIKQYLVTAKIPDSEGFWFVGLRMLDGWKLQCVLKDKESETVSDDFTLKELL